MQIIKFFLRNTFTTRQKRKSPPVGFEPNKGEYIGYLVPTITDDATIDQTEAHQANSIMLQKMMAEQVKPDVFNLPCH